MLSKLAISTPGDLSKKSFFEVVKRPNTLESISILQVDSEPNWVDPFLRYLRDGTLQMDPKEAKKLRNQTSRYILHENKLCKRPFSLPLLICPCPSKADYALQNLHAGICENHLRGRSLAYKVLQQEYYEPTMQQDAIDLVKWCD